MYGCSRLDTPNLTARSIGSGWYLAHIRPITPRLFGQLVPVWRWFRVCNRGTVPPRYLCLIECSIHVTQIHPGWVCARGRTDRDFRVSRVEQATSSGMTTSKATAQRHIVVESLTHWNEAPRGRGIVKAHLFGRLGHLLRVLKVHGFGY